MDFLDGSIFLDFSGEAISVGTWPQLKQVVALFWQGLQPLSGTQDAKTFTWATTWGPYLGQDSLLSWMLGDGIACFMIMGFVSVTQAKGSVFMSAQTLRMPSSTVEITSQ